MKNVNQDEENAEPKTTKRELNFDLTPGWIIRQQKLFSLYCYSLFNKVMLLTK